MLRIVTDGSADMPEGWEKEYEIEVIPLRIRFGEETFIQGKDINKQNFYQFVELKKVIPKTSLPSPQQVLEFYRSIARKGDEILSIHISSKLSGTFETIQMAAREINEFQKTSGLEYCVFPFDSRAGSAILGFMCREARLLARQGRSLNDIIRHLDTIRKQVVVIFTLDNLEYARLNGRVSALQSALSSMLNVKPIIVLKDGLLNMAEKVRTRQKAIRRVLEYVQKQVGTDEINMAVVHADDSRTAEQLLSIARSFLNIREAFITDLAIPVAANLGPGTIGIAAYKHIKE